MEGEPLCDNLTLLNKFAKKTFEFYSPDENKLFEKTNCLLPCSFMEYRVSFIEDEQYLTACMQQLCYILDNTDTYKSSWK